MRTRRFYEVRKDNFTHVRPVIRRLLKKFGNEEKREVSKEMTRSVIECMRLQLLVPENSLSQYSIVDAHENGFDLSSRL